VESEAKIVDLIVSCVEKTSSETLDKNPENDKKLKKSLRSRARELPSELFSRGLAYVLAYISSRGSLRIIEAGLKADRCDQMLNTIKDSGKLSETEFGYSVYGAILLLSLKKAGVVRGNKLSEVIREAMAKPEVEIAAQAYAEWIKRFVEAYIEE
jgi:CRISPR type III-B/RAMP module-associated protein Cmr5